MPSSFVNRLVGLWLTVWIASAAMGASTLYSVTDLGSLGGDSVAYAINNQGQVVGTCEGVGDGKAFIWDAVHGIRELQGLGGDYTYAYAINDAGTAVGGAWTGDNQIHATLWAGQLTASDISTGPNQTSIAFGINTAGATAIQAVNDGGNATRMVIRSPSGQMTDYGTLSGSNAIAWAINDAGIVALQWDAYGLPLGNPQIWSQAFQLMFLSKPDGANSSALYALSNVDTGAGATFLPGEPGNWRAIYWEVNPVRVFPGNIVGITTVLPTLGGATIAWGINDLNQAVGTSSIDPFSADDLKLRAFFYDHGAGEMYDLNTLLVPGTGWLLLGAQDINENGQIVGWGINPDGQRHAFLLTPVPEPAGAGVMLLGMGAVLLRRRTRTNDAVVNTTPAGHRHAMRRGDGYTLLELVVTASITVVVFTLIMPGIGQVRQASITTGCQGNTKFLCDMALHYAA
ncbi:MAG: PEP-CTERM sorting domain-containing protein, partial [Phycisphaeraceae bacterium]|nr:PEP-CTERM sorting domain-containing protein [Phycisphaeraceae bacterium]